MLTRPNRRAAALWLPWAALLLGWAALASGPALAATPAGAVSFPLAAGFSDVIPHQLVRTADDRLYAIAIRAQASPSLRAFWTTAPGLPAGGADFAGQTAVTDTANLISAEAAYDGAGLIHVLVNTQAGQLKDYVLDTAAGAFRPALVLASGNPTVVGDYIGTSGVSAAFRAGQLHVAYWSAGQHIIYRAYTYQPAAHALALTAGPVQVDTAGGASHPALAASPLDQALTIAWVSQATNPAAILARTLSGAGGWGAVETVSTSPVWTSTSLGISVDQGPSLVIDGAGVRHLAYIQNFDASARYGRIHHARSAGAGWQDQALSTYTHDPALALDSAGGLSLLGHGFSLNPACPLETELCLWSRNPDGSWGAPQPLAVPAAPDSFDASVSVKWSAENFNRPESVEFLFFAALGGNYNSTLLYYGRLAAVATATPSPSPSATPSPTPPATPTALPTASASPTPPPTFTPEPPSATAGPSPTTAPLSSATPSNPAPAPATPASTASVSPTPPPMATRTATPPSFPLPVTGASRTVWLPLIQAP